MKLTILPDQYKTGNAKTDARILAALQRESKILPKSVGMQMVIEEARVKQNKYHVAEVVDRTYSDGTVFASKREMERWHYLLQLERSGQISNLQRQVPFMLQESFISRQWGDIGHIMYVADFVYTNISFRKDCLGRKIVEDSKGGVLTGEYRLKKKLFLHKYGELLFFEV